MSLLMGPHDAGPRRDAIENSADLRSLRERLEEDLAPFLERPLYVPPEKALLSRWGSLCRDDGAELAFDPFSPDAHRCTRCGRIWSTEQAHRWWIYWYQLWLAERTLVAAHLAVLGRADRCAPRAVEALGALAEAYAGYPNRDNVLGPSRPFFSTYLESVWVLQLAAAASVTSVKVTGVTVHIANEVFDEGAIIAQEAVPIAEDDTIETLEAKIHEVEHRILPYALGLIADGRTEVVGRKVKIGIPHV